MQNNCSHAAQLFVNIACQPRFTWQGGSHTKNTTHSKNKPLILQKGKTRIQPAF